MAHSWIIFYLLQVGCNLSFHRLSRQSSFKPFMVQRLLRKLSFKSSFMITAAAFIATVLGILQGLTLTGADKVEETFPHVACLCT